MNYEEKYKKGLSFLKDLKPHMSDYCKEKLEGFFPELRKSEDERIRKGLIKGLSAMRDIHKHQTSSDDAINIDDAIAWLEKQGKKPAEWSEEDEKMLKLSLENLTELKNNFGKEYGKVSDCIDWLKSLKDRVQPQPKQEWSEDDKAMLLHIIEHFEWFHKEFRPDVPTFEIDWLKSLKPNHWKPSEQNIKDLEWCADLVKDKMGVGFHRIQVFIDDLRKAMEE